MPGTANITNVAGLDPRVKSIRYWLYATQPQWPQPPAAMPGGEVPLNQAKCVVFEAFDGPLQGQNPTGNSLGRGMESQNRLLMDVYTATDVPGLLVQVWPAPIPD